MYNVVKNHFD